MKNNDPRSSFIGNLHILPSIQDSNSSNTRGQEFTLPRQEPSKVDTVVETETVPHPPSAAVR